ncbi:MAG: hypothetical protein JXA22_06490 [Candidatus Thermoplasmatota archaeon]|nr:hypothetical protein [Candidatus Thermoplasmatota archaeon]
MGDTLKIWTVLALGAVMLIGSAVFVSAFQEPAGEEKGTENENGSGTVPEGSGEGPMGYTEMFGQFTFGEEGLTGRYVSFGFEEEAIIDYQFVPEEEIIFSSISADVDLFAEENTRMEGAVFHAETEGLHFMSHNNPTSMIHFTYSGEEVVTIHFTLAEGMTFGEVSEGMLPVLGLASEAWIFIGTEDLTVMDNNLDIDMTTGVIVHFHRNPYQTASSFQEKSARAISEGNVDGEIQVMSKAGVAEPQHFPYQGKVQMQLKGSETGDMLKFQVQSEEKAGKVLMFKIQGDLLDEVDAGKVRVEFDGQNALRTGTPDEVLNDDGEQCRYYLEKDEIGCYQAMVRVPGFSTHEITFQVEDDTDDSPFLPTMLVLLSVMVPLIAIAVIIGRKK